jgi:hypothetical protein
MKTIPLTRGQVAFIDKDDYSLVACFKWACVLKGKRRTKMYAQHGSSGKYMHRLIVSPPPGMEVDHINGDSLDNRRANLRICTTAQNRQNKRKSSTSKSRFKGVCWITNKKRWQASISSNYKNYNLGRYKNEEDAAIAYNIAAQLFFGEYANLNKI